MLRRLFWVMVGLGLGAVVGMQLVRWAQQTKTRYAPPNLAREAAGKLGQLRARVRDALDAGAEEMGAREAEIRAEIGLPPR